MSEGAEPPAPGPSFSLFRTEVSAEPEFGEALAFTPPPWRSLALLGVAAACLFLAFAAFASFDKVAQAHGIVAPASGVARLNAPQPGIVRAVLVREGDSVAKGAPLLRIASPRRLADDSVPARTLDAIRAQQRAAQAVQAAERERGNAEELRLRQAAREQAAALDAINVQYALQERRIASNERRLQSLAPLRERGYVSDFTYRDQEEQVLTLRQQLAGLGQRRAEAEYGLRAARLRLTELAAQSQRAERQAEGAQLELERGAIDAAADAEITLAAPVGGLIASLRASEGAAVAAGENLGAVVRSGEPLEVLLFLPASTVGAVRPGQEVSLRYDAFPWQHHGVGRGIVTQVAAAASHETPNGPPLYRARVRIVDSSRFALRADMSLTARIVVERRSLLDWLFAPIIRSRPSA